jgi:hypothetical protein
MWKSLLGVENHLESGKAVGIRENPSDPSRKPLPTGS